MRDEGVVIGVVQTKTRHVECAMDRETTANRRSIIYCCVNCG